MGKVFEIPLNAGLDEGGDRAMLEMGKLRILNNARITRDNRIEVRPQYVAQAMTVWGGSALVAQDLASYEDRLLAFGTNQANVYSQDVFTDVDVTQAEWKGSFDATAVVFPTFCNISELEILWSAPSGTVMTSSDIAYTNGYVCAVQTEPNASISKIYVLRGDIALPVQTLTLSSVRSARVVASGNVFILLTRTVAGNIEARTFDTTSATVFSGATVLEAAVATGTFTWDATIKVGSTDFLVCYPAAASANIRIRRYDQALVQQATVTLAVAAGDMCIIGDATRALFCYVTAAGNANLYTLNPTTLATTSGPTSVLGPAAAPTTDACVGTPALSVSSATNCLVESSCNTGLTVASQGVYRVMIGHAFVSGERFDDVLISSKLFTIPKASNFLPQGLGSLVVRGHILGTDQIYATCIQGAGPLDGFICSARWNFAVADRMNDFRVTNYHGRSSVVTDGLGTFWAVCGTLNEGLLGGTSGGTLQVVRFKSGVIARRQAAESQGALYITGGYVGYYDGSTLTESGFLDTPKILNTVQSTAGGLTQLGTYDYRACYEWYDAKGRLHRGTPCEPFRVVLTGVNDDVTLTVSTPRSLRRVDFSGGGSTVAVVIFRTQTNDSVMFRVGAVAAGSVAPTDYATPVSFLDTMSDATAADGTHAILYTQAQKPTANFAPQPCRFVAVGRDRLIFGGLPDPYLVSFSQLPFPAEPLESADPNKFAYVARLPEPVTAVAAPGDSYIAFTEQGIYEIPGAGPQRNGTGEFFTPRTLYSDGGCIDWRSVCDTAAGVFFQLASDKLYMLSTQGELIWVGKPVQDTLTSFPVVRATTLCTATQRVAFAVVDNDTTPTTGGILIYDIQKNAWSFDNVGIVQSLVEYQSRLAYLHNDGIVYLEQATIASGGGALPTVSIRTGSIRLFAAMGYGDVIKIGLLGTYLGDCTVEGFISYDDGTAANWVSMGQQPVTTANLFNPQTGAALAAGDPVSIIFTPNKRTVDRFALRFDVTNGTNTGGMRAHAISLEAESQEFTTRQPARNQR